MNNFNIIQWNLRGYHAQRPHLQKLIDNTNPSIICLHETHLKPQNDASLSKYHYPPVRHDRLDRRGGGTAIFIKNTIPHIPIDHNIDLELAAAKIFINNKTITI